MHQLHFAQSVPTHAEESALRRNMPQHNNENEEALKKHRHTFAPAAAVWGQMGRLWTDIARTSRTAETITTADYVAFFYQYLGYTDDTVLAPIAQEQCRCCAYFHESDHINCINCCPPAGTGTSPTSIWGRRCCVSFSRPAIPPARRMRLPVRGSVEPISRFSTSASEAGFTARYHSAP